MKILNKKVNRVKRFANSIQMFLFRLMSALSFLMIPFYFGYIVYYSVIDYDIFKTLIGCASLYAMIHLNKSL